MKVGTLDFDDWKLGKETFEDFEIRYRKLLSKLQDAQALTREFSECSSNADSISFVSDNPQIGPKLREQFSFRIRTAKSDRNSRFYRDLGNKAYQHKKYLEALKLYNKSLICSLNGSQEIAVIYANRSAVFYAMKKYDECLKNLEAALNYNYPEKLKFKLIERYAKAKKAMGLFKEVLTLEQQWREAVEVGDIPEEKKLEISKVIDLLMKECRFQDDSLKEKFVRVTLIDEPIGESNENVPAMSNKLHVQWTEEMGRHVVAKEDIPPGLFVLGFFLD